MVFWIIITLMALAVAGILVLAMRQGRTVETDPGNFDLQVYRDQLAEVDRDLARGVLDAQDAERVRTEISRRILLSDKDHETVSPTGQGRGWMIVAGLLTLGLIAGSGLIYTRLGAPGYGDLALKDRVAGAEQLRTERPGQIAAEESLSTANLPPLQEQDPQYLELVRQLRGVIAERPNDQRGLRLLAISERNLGNFTQARAAFERYVNLRGDQATPADLADLADLMVIAAGGYVSPEAEATLARGLEADPGNGPARYYWGLMMAQTGRPDQAFRIWDQLLRQGPADAPWIPPIQAQIEDVAMRAGVNYVLSEPGTGRGPSAADIEAAGEMSSTDRLEMIEGMVGGLSERLATEGGTVAEWGQLITALGVLGRQDQAAEIYREAQQRFAEDPSALDQLFGAAERAGIAN